MKTTTKKTTKVQPFPKGASSISAATNKLETDCQEYAAVGTDLIRELKAGRMDRDDVRAASSVLSSVVKSANVRVQKQHAHHNLVKQSVIVEARDRETPGTAQRVIATAKALSNLDPSKLKEAMTAA